MTQKEAIIEALNRLGGKAKMGDICKLAKAIGDFSRSQTPDNTIRNCIYTNPDDFRSSNEKGYWELLSYQEEVANLMRENRALRESNELLKSIPKEAEFIDKFLREVMDFYKFDRMKADSIRIILKAMGYENAVDVLDAWINKKEDELTKALLKLAERPTYGAYYASGSTHDDKRSQLLLGEEKEKRIPLKRTGNE